VRDVAEDLDPSFSPDGRRLIFRGERNGRTGLWLLNLSAGDPRQLTQLSNPEGYDGNASWSPNGHTIAFTRSVPPDSQNSRGRSAIELLDVDSGAVRELSITGLSNTFLSDPAWVQDGKQIAFVTRNPQSSRGGRVWSRSFRIAVRRTQNSLALSRRSDLSTMDVAAHDRLCST
jgi:TolB protein